MKKILIIEDNNSIREEISTILRFEDFEVIEAKNGMEGINKAQTEKPALILCDVLMPEMDGFEVLALLRNNPEYQNVYFIFLTSITSAELLERIDEFEFTGYLRKPVDSEALLEVINRYF